MTGDRSPAARRGNVIPLLRRAGEAVKVIFGLADSIAEFKAKNDTLSLRVAELRRDLDQQAGQVKVLIRFVQSALDDRVRGQAEAAVRAILAEHENRPGTKESGKKSKKKRAIRQGGSEPRRSGRS